MMRGVIPVAKIFKCSAGWRSRLVVQVVDRWQGIPQEKLLELAGHGRTGVGFGGIRERLRQLGGTLEIKSEGNGTCVSAILNLESVFS